MIGGLLGFLPWGVEGVGKVREQNIAYGLVDAVEVELERMGFSTNLNPILKDWMICTIRVLLHWNRVKFSLLLVSPKDGGVILRTSIVTEQDTTYLNNPDNQQEGENVQVSKKILEV